MHIFLGKSVIRNNEFGIVSQPFFAGLVYILLQEFLPQYLRQESKQYFSRLFYWYQFYRLPVIIYPPLLYIPARYIY